MHVPATPAELGAAWLEEVLAPTCTFRGIRIRGVETRLIGVGYGLDGTVARIALEVDGGPPEAPTSLVAKLASGPRGRDEVVFYDRIAPRMPIRVPRCFAGFVSEGADRAVLLLEDLDGAVQGDAVSGTNRAQTEAVLAAMARFHAVFQDAGHEVIAALPLWRAEAPARIARLRERMPRFLGRYEAGLDQRALHILARLGERLEEAGEVLEAAPPTLTHTDLHADNVLFLPSGEPVVLDWPHARRGPAALDVARFLVEGAHPDVRRTHDRELRAGYARARAAAGAPLVAAGRTEREHEAAVLWYLATAASWAGAEDPGFATPRVRGIVDSLVRNTTAAAMDLPLPGV